MAPPTTRSKGCSQISRRRATNTTAYELAKRGAAYNMPEDVRVEFVRGCRRLRRKLLHHLGSCQAWLHESNPEGLVYHFPMDRSCWHRLVAVCSPDLVGHGADVRASIGR
eukprot:30329-Pyramimonas_sp.AAC.1